MWKQIFYVVVFVGCMWTTGGLRCFQCLDAAPDGSCMNDYEGMVDAREGNYDNGTYSYVKECHDGINYAVPAQNYCVIEAFYLGGELVSFIRDCSDGVNFSFTGDQTADTPKLQNIAADNFTTCVYRMGARTHICITLCEGEDFCNGPLSPPNDTCSANSTNNETCGAGFPLFLTTPGPFGPIVDRVLGRGYFMPLMAAILSVGIFG